MRYNYHELDRVDQWSLIALITLAKSDPDHIDTESINVTLTVEGVELDILAFVNRLKVQMDRWVHEEARVMIDEKVGGLLDTIDAVHEVLREQL